MIFVGLASRHVLCSSHPLCAVLVGQHSWVQSAHVGSAGPTKNSPKSVDAESVRRFSLKQLKDLVLEHKESIN
jgi:hypothetical protein